MVFMSSKDPFEIDPSQLIGSSENSIKKVMSTDDTTVALMEDGSVKSLNTSFEDRDHIPSLDEVNKAIEDLINNGYQITEADILESVSYTHLTLPTNREV